MGSLIHFLSTRVDLFFELYKLEKFSSSAGKLHVEGLVQLLRYIRDKNNLGFKYYANIEDAPLYEILRQAIINTENQLMVLSDSIWKDCPYTGISTGEYFVIYQG